MGRTPVRSRTAQRMREDQQRARKAAENAHNRAMLATYTFNEVSPEQYLAYQQNRTNRVADFDIEAFSQYNDLRSQEFAREFSANLRDYNQELRASPNKNRQLQQWGVRNRTLYCAELTDMICDESARNLGFSEYSNVTACRNRDYCPTVAMDLLNVVGIVVLRVDIPVVSNLKLRSCKRKTRTAAIWQLSAVRETEAAAVCIRL